MAVLRALPEAVADLVHDGDAVAMEGLTHLTPLRCRVTESPADDELAALRELTTR